MSSKAFLPDSKYAAARASSRQLQTLFSEATSAAEQFLADLSRSIWGSHTHAWVLSCRALDEGVVLNSAAFCGTDMQWFAFQVSVVAEPALLPLRQ